MQLCLKYIIFNFILIKNFNNVQQNLNKKYSLPKLVHIQIKIQNITTQKKKKSLTVIHVSEKYSKAVKERGIDLMFYNIKCILNGIVFILCIPCILILYFRVLFL